MGTLENNEEKVALPANNDETLSVASSAPSTASSLYYYNRRKHHSRHHGRQKDSHTCRRRSSRSRQPRNRRNHYTHTHSHNHNHNNRRSSVRSSSTDSRASSQSSRSASVSSYDSDSSRSSDSGSSPSLFGHHRSRVYRRDFAARRPRQPRFWPKNAASRTNFTSGHFPPPPQPPLPPFSSDEAHSGLRRNLQIFLDDPSSSRPAMYFALFIAGLVVTSSLGVIIESLPEFYGHQSLYWYCSEGAVMSIFTVELLLRCFAHSTSWKQFRRFLFSFGSFIDFIAIVPYYVEMALTFGGGRDCKYFTVFRLFRLIRLLHCYGYSSVLQLSMDAMFIAMKKSADALMTILFFQFFTIVIFSTLLYFAERGTWNEATARFEIADGSRSNFDSIPATFWFVAEVITTVGLGDISPVTVLGKFLTFPLMIFGILIIALPSIVLGKNFAEAWLWLKTAGNFQKQKQQSLALRQKQQPLKSQGQARSWKSKPRRRLSLDKAAEHGEKPPGGQLSTHEFDNHHILSTADLTEPHPEYPEHSPVLDYATAIEIGSESNTAPGREDKRQFEDEEARADRQQEDEEAYNEAMNGETMRSTDHPYYISPETLIQSENQNEILQLVQILVDQFQTQTQVIERLSLQQEDLLTTVTNMKRMQQKGATFGRLDSELSPHSQRDHSRSSSRARSRSRPRSRTPSRSQSRSHTRSRSPRGRSRSSAGSTRGRSPVRSVDLERRHSRSRSPSRHASPSSSRSRHHRHHHRRRVSSCSSCESRYKG